MNKELDDKLCKDFPNLFADRNGSMHETCMCWGFPGDGWYNLIREAAEKLEPLIVAIRMEYPQEYFPRAAQVKEKFGTLRFYMSSATEEMDAIIGEAERKSAITCEECGKTGRLREGGWLLTLCDDCGEKRYGQSESNL